MQNIIVSRRIFEMLVSHLTRIEEEKVNVIEKYYPDWTNERNDFQELLNTYIKNVEGIIYKNLEVQDQAPDTCPFVIIGSQVIFRDSYTNKIEKLHLVSPFKGEINFEVDSASYLSPMGRALLLRRVHDDVEVETPMGIFQYRIEAIELPADIFQYY